MTYKVIDIDQGSEAWHDFRREHIGSSNAPSIMGEGYDTPYEVFMEKLGFGKKKYENEAMRLGKEREPIAREEFIKQTGILMVPQVIESTVYPFLSASLDGLDFSGKIGLEIKCPTKKENHEMAMDGIIPQCYVGQLQHQMWILQIPMIYYFSYTPESSKIIEVPYDPIYTQTLIEKELEFKKCLDNLVPPLSDRDYLTRTDDLSIQLAQKHQLLVQKEKEIEKEKELIRNQLIELAGESNMKVGDLSICKVVTKGKIDYKAACKDLDIQWESHRKPSSTYWRIT